MVGKKDAVKLRCKRAVIAKQAGIPSAHDLLAFLAADGNAVLFDELPFLMLALELDCAVRKIVDADPEFVPRTDPARFFPERGIERIVEIQAAYKILPAVDRGVIILFQARANPRGEQLVLSLGDDVFQFVPVLLAASSLLFAICRIFQCTHAPEEIRHLRIAEVKVILHVFQRIFLIVVRVCADVIAVLLPGTVGDIVPDVDVILHSSAILPCRRSTMALIFSGE
jgi:hypothetical protein